MDSRTIPDVAQPQSCFDKGDGINFSIASASILAKVHRDRIMTEFDVSYPGYGFCAERLSEMENKKLQLMRSRLWKRIAG